MFFFFDLDISVLLFWVVGCFCCLNCVSDAEQQLTSAGDILLWNQIIEADQFFLSALRAGMLWIPAHCIFFVFRCTHFERLLPAFMPTPLSGRERRAYCRSMRTTYTSQIWQARKILPWIVGLGLRPRCLIMSPPCARILRRVAEMARQGSSGNPEQLGGPALVAIGLLVNKLDVTADSTGKTEVNIAVANVRGRYCQMVF